jgi:hypothetical protein
MIIICELVDADGVFAVVFPAELDPADYLVPVVGVGFPFYAFAELPLLAELQGGSIAWDPTGAPVCSDDPEANGAAIDAMLANPPLSKVFAA